MTDVRARSVDLVALGTVKHHTAKFMCRNPSSLGCITKLRWPFFFFLCMYVWSHINIYP